LNFDWFVWDDSPDGGTSTIAMTQGSGNDSKKFTFSGDAKKIQGQTWGNVGWVAQPDNASLAALKNADSFSFKCKGMEKNYVVMVYTSDITDYDDYHKVFTVSTAEQTITVQYSDLAQEGGGAQKPFNKNNITKIGFQARAQSDITGEGPFSVTMWDFQANGGGGDTVTFMIKGLIPNTEYYVIPGFAPDDFGGGFDTIAVKDKQRTSNSAGTVIVSYSSADLTLSGTTLWGREGKVCYALERNFNTLSKQYYKMMSATYTLTAPGDFDYDNNANLPEPEPMTSLDASTFLSSLKLGVNIGCSFNSYPYDDEKANNFSETASGNPVIKQALLNGIAAAGFEIVRLPVTWIAFIGSAPDYKVDKSRLSRIAEVVKMAHNAGLKIIINTHHDDGFFIYDDEKMTWYWDCGWLRVDKAGNDPIEKEKITAKFQALWRQIAEYFINYGDYLIFESFNELGLHYSPTQVELGIINEWNRVFIDTVRETGGNNSSRFLMLHGYEANLDHNFVLPTDKKNTGTNKLIVGFHFYDPPDFTHEYASTWGDALTVDNRFKYARECINSDVPIILDEFGLKYNPSNEEAQKNYLSCVVGTAHKYGMPALFWDDGWVFLLFNRNTSRLFPVMESYVQVMKEAVR